MTDPRIGPVADRPNPPTPVDEPVERTAVPPPTPVERAQPVSQPASSTAPPAAPNAPTTPAAPDAPASPVAPEEPAAPAAPRTDWETRDRRDDETPRHAADSERLIGADERLAVGEPEVELRSARVSWLAITGLVLGVVGVLGALTAELLPVAAVIGVVGLLFSIAGLYATRHRLLASRPLAVTALVVCLGALALAVMAYTGQFDWLNRTDQAGWLREWLNDRIPGFADW